MLKNVESIKELLTNFSTGILSDKSPEKYIELRRTLMSAPSYRTEIPEWLKGCVN